jgi:hypothetical protein
MILPAPDQSGERRSRHRQARHPGEKKTRTLHYRFRSTGTLVYDWLGRNRLANQHESFTQSWELVSDSLELAPALQLKARATQTLLSISRTITLAHKTP